MNSKLKLRVFACIFLVMLIAPVTILAQETLSGIISGELEAGDYLVIGDVNVNDSLTIAPGTRILFDGNFTFNIAAYFSAVGTDEDSIYFIPNEDISYWGNITLFTFEDDSIIFDHCYFSGAHASAMYVTSGFNTLITNCTFYDNFASYGGAISIANSNPIISNCHFENNQAQTSGGAIHCNGAQPVIDNCTFIDNNGGNWGGALNYYSNSSGILRNSTLSGNFCASTGGGIHCSSSSPEIDSCLIEDNSAGSYGGGINIYNDSNPVITRTILAGNTCTNNGGGIYSTRSQPTVDHCVIINNDANGWGDGIYFYADEDERKEPVLTNSIVYSNEGSGVYMMNVDPFIAFNDVYDNISGNFGGQPPNWLGVSNHQNSAGEACDLMFNISVQPAFTLTNYNLTSGSPCIDTGDFLADPDPDNTIADMGVNYYNHATSLEPPEPPSTIVFTGTTQLRYMNDHTGIEVIFAPISPSAEADTFYTDENGAYSGSLIRGLYNVYFFYDDFHPDSLNWVLVNSAIPITPVILEPVGISGDTSGVFAAGTYVITGDLHIADDDTLTLDPGCTLLFDDGVDFTIDGLLLAEGTETDSIRFMPLQEYWGGIEFTSDAEDSSVFRYCYITGSNSSAIETDNTDLTISHSIIDGNSSVYFGNGIKAISECEINLDYCQISNNSAGGNQTEGGALAVYYDCVLNMYNCTIADNSSYYGSAILARSSTLNVGNTIFYNNLESSAIRVYQPVANNFNYNIFYSNTSGNFEGEMPSELGMLSTVNTLGDSVDTFNNLFISPRFTPNSNYLLSNDSPCINSGDPELPADDDLTCSDMGAYHKTLTASHIRLAQTSINYGDVPVNDSYTLLLPVINLGTENLVLQNASITIPEFVIEDINNLEIAPSERVELEITFTPVLQTLYNTQLSIETNDEEQLMRVVLLAGNGAENAVSGNETVLPEKFDIESIYPNPFNSQTRIKIGLPDPGILNVILYNTLGQQVAVLSNDLRNAGWHEFSVNATNMASGLYFIRAQSQDINITRKLILVR